MRFMMIVKADKDSEAGVLPDEKVLAEMAKSNRGDGEGGRDARRRGASGQLEGRARHSRAGSRT